jgi:hypothetical protein
VLVSEGGENFVDGLGPLEENLRWSLYRFLYALKSPNEILSFQLFSSLTSAQADAQFLNTDNSKWNQKD